MKRLSALTILVIAFPANAQLTQALRPLERSIAQINAECAKEATSKGLREGTPAFNQFTTVCSDQRVRPIQEGFSTFAKSALRVVGNLLPLTIGIWYAGWLRRKNSLSRRLSWPIVIGAIISVPAALITVLSTH